MHRGPVGEVGSSPIDHLLENPEEHVRSLIRYALLPVITLVIITLIALAAAIAD